MTNNSCWMACLLLVSSVGCGLQGDDELALSQDGARVRPEPSGLGPYPVGVATWAIEDRTRLSGDLSFRRVRFEVWYPADEAARGQPGHVYTSENILSGEALAVLGAGFPSSPVPTIAVRDAAPRRSAGPFPVVLFSHGAGGYRAQSSFLTSYLASHGYVVLAPDHDGDTLSDYIERGGLNPVALAFSFFDRPRDLELALRHLRGLEGRTSDPFAGLADLSRVGIAGHSHGAATALRSATLIPGVDAVVVHGVPRFEISWLLMPAALENQRVPALIVVGDRDVQTTAADAASIWRRLRRPKIMLELGNAGHFTYSDACLMDPAALAFGPELFGVDIVGGSCSAENTPPDVAHRLIRQATIATFDLFLKRDARALGDLETRDFEAIAPGESVLRKRL